MNSPSRIVARYDAAAENELELPKVLIPGPVEVDPKVLHSMSHISEPHTCQGFANVFGDTLSMLRPVFQNKNSTAQPFVISGSGTLGMDMVAASLVEPGDKVLVLSAGTFGQNFSCCLKAYRADVTLLEVDRPGGGFTSHHIEKALQEDETEYAMVVVTHVETSTGVRNDVAAIASCVRQLLPSAIIVVDAVCSLGVEDLRFDDWDLDVVISCSQKGLGCPAGLSIMMLSSRALLKLESRAAPISGFYSSLFNWLPIMKSYEGRKSTRYFATPPTQLIRALHCALSGILSIPLEDRFAAHRISSLAVKRRLLSLGLRPVAIDPEFQSHALTAMFMPLGIDTKYVLTRMLEAGFYVAGGIHAELGPGYLRIGHMGVTVTDKANFTIGRALDALETVLGKAGRQAVTKVQTEYPKMVDKGLARL